MFNAETQRREVRREVLGWGCTPDPLGEADCKNSAYSATLRLCVKNTKG